MISAVEDYYQRNTGLFLRLGGGRKTGSIHRPIWADTVHSTEEAFTYAYALVAEHVYALFEHRETASGQNEPLRILDLGCGVGGALRYLAGVFGSSIEATGITISPDQVRRAEHDAELAAVAEICRFTTGDFHALPDLPPVDLAFSIEAFVQGHNPAKYFAEAFSVLRPGGRLIIIDDFERDSVERNSETHRNRRFLELFEKGWHANAFGKCKHARELAESAGFLVLEEQNLTPLLRLGRPRDHFIAWFVAPIKPLIWWHPYGRSLVGGAALQKGLRKGLIEYRKMVFEKPR